MREGPAVRLGDGPWPPISAAVAILPAAARGACRSGHYETHVAVVEDDCQWHPFVADPPTSPVKTSLLVSRSSGEIAVAVVARSGLGLFPLAEAEDYRVTAERTFDCGREDWEVELLELSEDAFTLRSVRSWSISGDCGASATEPLSSCACDWEQTSYLLEVCEPPCRVQGLGDALSCECD